MRDIGLIVTDLDNTFTNSKYDFCPENGEAVRLAQKMGIRVCACTARNWGLAKGQVRRAGFDQYTVTSNGGSIVDNDTGIPVVRHRLEASDVERLLLIGIKHSACVGVYTNEQILYLDGQAAAHYCAYPGQWATVDRDLAIPATCCKSVLEMVVLGAEAAELVEISRPDFSSLDEEERAFLSKFSVSGIGGYCLFVLQQGVSKLSGVQELSKIMGIPRERVMAVGDNINDVEMLQWAGIGVAVANGDDRAKAAADYITLDHDKAGFYHAVMELAIGEGSGRRRNI